MGLKRAENQVKILLQETIIALCRNTLNSYGEVSVEGLLGVTLDNEEIFLVSINEMFNNPGVAKKAKKNLKRSKEANDNGSESESEHSDGDDHGDAPKKRKKKRARKKKKRTDQGSGGSGEDSDSSSNQDNNDDDLDGGTETENNTTQEDDRHHGNNEAHEIRPEAPSSRNTIPDDQIHSRPKKEPSDDHRHSDEDSHDLQKVSIKEECDEDDDEDLVFVKEEMGDASFHQNQYSNYSSDGQMYMPQGGMQGLQPGVGGGHPYSQQDFIGDISNMSQGSDSQQIMGLSSPGQHNMVSPSGLLTIFYC